MVFEISRFDSDIYLLRGDEPMTPGDSGVEFVTLRVSLYGVSFLNVYSVEGKVRLGRLGSPILFKVKR